MKTFYCTIIVWGALFILPACGQNGLYPIPDARFFGMNQTGVGRIDRFCFFNNPAALAFFEEGAVQAGAIVPYSIPALQKYAVGAVLPGNTSSWGFLLNQYGSKPFKEGSMEVAFSLLLDKELSLGIRGGFWNTRIDGYGQDITPTYGLGMLKQLEPELTIGFFIRNPLVIKDKSGLFKATTIDLGMCYQPNSYASVQAELQKSTGQATRLKMGVEYQMHPHWWVRSGFQVFPARFALGCSLFLSKNLYVDWGGSIDPILGITPSLGLRKQGISPTPKF